MNDTTPSTPGTWTVLEHFSDKKLSQFIVADQTNCGICHINIPVVARKTEIEEKWKHAQLIATSPDLLDVVRRVYEYERERMEKDDQHFHEEEIEAWGELIALAEGRKP